jgi:hypothetical protein
LPRKTFKVPDAILDSARNDVAGEVQTVNQPKETGMAAVCDHPRKMFSILFLSAIVLMLSGAAESVWSAADAPATTDRQSPAPPSDSSVAPAEGAEGKGRSGMKKACAEDAKKLCSGVKPGEGRIARCLRQHAQELSPGCVEMMQQRAKGRR